MNYSNDPSDMMKTFYDFWDQQFKNYQNAGESGNQDSDSHNWQNNMSDFYNYFSQWQSLMTRGFQGVMDQQGPFQSQMQDFCNPFFGANKKQRAEFLEKHLDAVDQYRKLVKQALETLTEDNDEAGK